MYGLFSCTEYSRAIAFEKFFDLNAIATSWIIVADDLIATPLSRKTPPTRKLSALKALQRSAKGQEARARRACSHLTQSSAQAQHSLGRHPPGSPFCFPSPWPLPAKITPSLPLLTA
jgi:hypothetical protein